MASTKDKVYALTGAASGIGLAIALELARLGARALSICDINATLFDAARGQIAAISPTIPLIFTHVDVTNSAALSSWIADTVEKFGALGMFAQNPARDNESTVKQLEARLRL